MRHLFSVLPLLPCLLLAPWPTEPENLGPGAVEMAVRDFVAATNSGDARTIDALLSREWDHLPVVAYDRDAAGKPISAYGHEAVAKSLASLGGKQELTHVWGMCQSPEVGYAYGELQRTTGTGKELRTERLRVTALARYDSKREAHRWEIFHWHVSPASEAAFPLQGFTATEAPRKDGPK